MSSKKFRFHPGAKEDIRDGAKWYRSQSRKAAAEFRAAVSSVIRNISRAPSRWPSYLFGTRRFVLQRFPFFVVYLDDPDVVNIVAVAHSKRKPGYWKNRL